MPKIKATGGRNHATITIDGEEFCTIYGKDWYKRFTKLKNAICLQYVIETMTMKDVNAVIKEIRKK